MGQHVDADGDCPLAVVTCRFADVGCKYKVFYLTVLVHKLDSWTDDLIMCNFRVCLIFMQTTCVKIKSMVSYRKRCAKCVKMC